MLNDVKMIIADREYFNNGIFKENFIPKSKVKEKIEEYKQKETLYSINRQGYSLAMVQYQINALQELMEEK